ncbi:PorV/PorQ family protein [bacterium]|nr:PorV/PorQ family protein [bacterium]
MKKHLFLLLALATNAFAAGGTDQISVNPRAKAMGDAFVAVSDDVYAMRYNPASLGKTNAFRIGMSYQKPYDYSFLKHFTGTVSLPWNRILGSQKFGTSGISLEFFGVDFDNGNYNSTDSKLWKETVISFSHGVKLMEDFHSNLSVGVTAKFYHLSLGKSLPDASGTRENLGNGNAVGLDFGVQGTLWQKTSFGGYLMNFNRPSFGKGIYAEDLPQKLVVGLAYKPYSDVITTLDLERELGRESQIKAGAEFWVVEQLALRVGINSNPNVLSTGFGLRIKGIEFDYSFTKHPVLDYTNQFGLTLDFDQLLGKE